ncbi:MAG: CopG family transcriptional regulator [Phycisphaerales bacterium]|nr:CopG family transcriptional regulator [Phycisphaerales bacterium]
MTKHKPTAPSSVPTSSGTRLSVTLPPDHYREMQHLASRKKVSMAWVVRDAVDQYLAAHGDPGSRPASGQRTSKSATGKGVA